MKSLSEQESIALVFALIVVAVTFFGVVGNPFTRTEVAQPEVASGPVTIDSRNDPEAAGRALAAASDESGNVTELLIEDTRVGTGPAVKNGDTISVHFIGALKDGTRFDDSTLRGEPFTFTVGAGSVIEAWDKGVVGMKAGGERVLIVPPSMAYGERGLGAVPPNATTLFSLTLVEIK
jgi:FKBP-type peptidyl-prolyl cis-trans isomerase